MSNARIVTDSSAEVDPQVADELGITVLPWRLRLGAETLADTPEMRTEAFYREAKSKQLTPTALAPTALQMGEAYARLCQDADDIVSIHPSTQLAPVLDAANQARASFLGRCRIHVLNGEFFSYALGLLAIEAGRAAQRGMSGEEIVRWIKGLVPHTYVAFYVDSPQNLVRRGVAREVETQWTSSSFKPLLLIERGQVIPLLRSRKRGTPIERLIEFIGEFEAPTRVALLHTGLRADYAELRDQLSDSMPDLAFEERFYGPVFWSSVGPEALCVVVTEAPA